jgi:hypothetical protein
VSERVGLLLMLESYLPGVDLLVFPLRTHFGLLLDRVIDLFLYFKNRLLLLPGQLPLRFVIDLVKRMHNLGVVLA